MTIKNYCTHEPSMKGKSFGSVSFCLYVYIYVYVYACMCLCRYVQGTINWIRNVCMDKQTVKYYFSISV